MLIISHSQFSFLTGMNGRTHLTQIIREAWSGIRMDPKPMKALVVGVYKWGSKGGIASVLGSTPGYFRRKYMPLRLA
jgi:hypothetical protein